MATELISEGIVKVSKGIKHAFLRTLSVVTTLLVIAGIGWAIYAGIVRPVTKPLATTSQKGTITNNYVNPTANEIIDIIDKRSKEQKKKFFLGTRIFGFEIGISR